MFSGVSICFQVSKLFAKALKVASKNTISTKDQSCSGQCPVNMEEVVEAKTLKEVEMTDNNRSWWIALIVEQLVAFGQCIAMSWVEVKVLAAVRPETKIILGSSPQLPQLSQSPLSPQSSPQLPQLSPSPRSSCL